MHVSDLTLAGWIHSVACLIALAAGAVILVAEKGTLQHRTLGSFYFWSMMVVNLSAFGIYRFDVAQFRPLVAGPHIFGLFHWFAVAGLVFVLVGRYAASRQDKAFWAYVHPVAMILSYYDLIGGGVNEVFERIDIFRGLAFPPGAHRNFGGSPVIGLVQISAIALTILLLIYFSMRVAYHRNAATREI
jgi:uncharacterized membrane protein